MQVQGGGDNRGAPDARPRPHAGQHTSQDQRVQLHGLPQGQERAHDVRQARQPQVQVRQQALLVRGLLRVDRRPERGDDSEVHQGAGGPRHRAGQVERQGVRGPVQEEVGEPL